MASCRPGSASGATIAASAGCMMPVRKHTQRGVWRSRSTPTRSPATAITIMSPEWASEKHGPAPDASTGLPDGRPQRGHGSRPNASSRGSAPARPARTRRSITWATWYRWRSAGKANDAARAASSAPSTASSPRLRAVAAASNHQMSAAQAAAALVSAITPAAHPLRNESGQRAHGGHGVKVQVLTRHINTEPALYLPQQQRARQRVQGDRLPEQGRPRGDVQHLVPPADCRQDGAYLIRDARRTGPAD